MVFNKGNGQQTVDLTRGTNGWFGVIRSINGKRNGNWTANCTTNCSSSNAMLLLTTNKISSHKNISITAVSPNPITDQTKLYTTTKNQGTLDKNKIGQIKAIKQ